MQKQKLKYYVIPYAVFFLFISYWGCENGAKNSEKNNVGTYLRKIEQTPLTDPNYLQLVDSLYKLSIHKDYKKGIAKSLSFKGSYLSSKGKYYEALEKFEAAVQVSKQINDLFQLGDDYNNIGGTYFNLKKRDEAIAAHKQAAAVRMVSNDSIGLGTSFNNLGFNYWLISSYDSAVFYFEKSLKIRNKLPNKTHRATTYNNLGTVFYNWSLYDKALDNYLRSLQYQRENGTASGIALCLCNIGLVYKETAQNEKAIEYYRESLPYAYSSKLTQTIGYAYSCLGAAFSTVNKDSALFYLKKSLETYRKGSDTVGVILALQGIGHYYLSTKEMNTAKNYFQQMLSLALIENIPVRSAEAYKCLGEIFLYENNIRAAEEYFVKSVAIGEKAKLKLILRDSHRNLSSIYERTGKIDKALSELKQSNYFQQLIENEGMQKRLSDLKNKSEYERYQRNLHAQQYENEMQKIYLIVTVIATLFLLITAIILFRLYSKRKKINILLQEKNALIEGQSKEINLKNVELLELNEAKEKLFSIIGHDLRSPFNTLISLATMLKEDYHEFSDKERLEYISGFEEVAIKTYELVENLLHLSASRTGRVSFNPDKVEVAKIIDKVFHLLTPQSQKKQVKLFNKIDIDTTAIADQPMLEIILRNLTNNAIKYSHAGGQIEISSDYKDHNLIIAVQDNGTGMDEETKTNIFNINTMHSMNGTGGEKGTGLGLGLCKEFVEKHGGSIGVESEAGKGSKFFFSLPLEVVATKD